MSPMHRKGQLCHYLADHNSKDGIDCVSDFKDANTWGEKCILELMKSGKVTQLNFQKHFFLI